MNTAPIGPSASAASPSLRWSETLHDRSHVLIRPLEPLDHAAEADFIAGLSLQAQRYHFLRQVASPSEALVDHPVDDDGAKDIALAAVVPEDAHQRIVGIVRAHAEAGASQGECAVAVAMAWQGRGLGTALMRHLIEVARLRGIRALYTVDAADNLEMLDLVRHLGFGTGVHPQDPALFIHRIEIEADPSAPP